MEPAAYADLVEDQNGNWWAVFLGIRNYSHALLHNLGRETFLAPVSWVDGWPIIGDQGHVELEYDLELPGGEAGPQDHSMTLDFSCPLASCNVMYTRNPRRENYVQDCEAKTLTLYGTDVTINEPGASPTALSFRQPDFETAVTAELCLDCLEAGRAGISAYYNNDYHYDIYGSRKDGKTFLGFYKHIHDMGVELLRAELPKEAHKLTLQIRTDRKEYAFYYKTDVQREWILAGSGLNAGLCTEGTYAMTFTGTMFALFAEQGKAVFLDQVTLACGEK